MTYRGTQWYHRGRGWEWSPFPLECLTFHRIGIRAECLLQHKVRLGDCSIIVIYPTKMSWFLPMPMGTCGGKWDTVGLLGILRLWTASENVLLFSLYGGVASECEWGYVVVVYTHYRVLEGHTEGLGYTWGGLLVTTSTQVDVFRSPNILFMDVFCDLLEYMREVLWFIGGLCGSRGGSSSGNVYEWGEIKWMRI